MSNDAGFTQGPWALYGRSDGQPIVPIRGVYEAAPGLTIGSVHNTEPIARVFGYMHNVEANTALIAAAPDLYEACKAIEEHLKSTYPPYAAGQSPYDKVRAALAKANGPTTESADQLALLTPTASVPNEETR